VSWISPSTTARRPGRTLPISDICVRSSYRDGSTNSRSWTCVTPSFASFSASAGPTPLKPETGRCSKTCGSGVATGASASAEVQGALDFDARIARKRGHRHRRPCRVRLGEVLRHELVDLREVCEVREENGDLHHLPERAARGCDHRFDVLENPRGLFLEVALDHLHGRGIERNLARHVYRVADAHRL